MGPAVVFMFFCVVVVLVGFSLFSRGCSLFKFFSCCVGAFELIFAGLCGGLCFFVYRERLGYTNRRLRYIHRR